MRTDLTLGLDTLHLAATPWSLFFCGWMLGCAWVAGTHSSQLFSDCLQLPIYTGAMRSTTMSKRELSQLASLVHSKFRLLELDLTPWLDVLPDGWGARLVSLRQGVRQELQQVCACVGRVERSVLWGVYVVCLCYCVGGGGLGGNC